MRVVFRTEGNHLQGMGDLWGSIALAHECLRHGDEILFVLSGGEEAISAVGASGFRVYTVDSFVAEQEILRAFRPDVVVVNKLKNSAEYIQSLKELAGLVVTIDDSGEGASYSDLRINVLYHVPNAVTDPKYITLRREFRELHGRTKTIKEQFKELLITQGGSDTYGFTPKIIRALETMTWRPHCTLVVGPTFQHHAELESAVATSELDLRLVFNASNMGDLMWDADLAITAGGLTMFELACVGTPSVVICAEPFEVETAARLEEFGVVRNLGFGKDMDFKELPKTVEALAADLEMRKQMSRRGQQLVDGRGCERIIRLINEKIPQATAVRP